MLKRVKVFRSVVTSLLAIVVLLGVVFAGPMTQDVYGASLSMTMVSYPPPDATVGTTYTLTASATGGVEPYTWSTVGKPSWLMLNATTGVLSGKPGVSAVGAVAFNLKVKDKNGASTSADLTFTVKPAP